MSINTPLGDSLGLFLEALLAGRSALSHWKALDVSRIYSKVGADLSSYDVGRKLAALEPRVPPEMHRRLRKLVPRLPWTTQLTVLMAIDGALDAGLLDAGIDLDSVAGIVAGHNINCNYQYTNRLQFEAEPDYIDALLAFQGLDTDHAACISEALGIRGPIYTVGAACASGSTALRCAVDEIRHHDARAAVVAGAVFDFSPLELHAMAMMGAITFQSFNDTPALASRPWDVRREGFVPAHGGGVMVLEDYDEAVARGARIYAEIMAIESNADGTHLPQPSEEGQTRLMRRVLEKARLRPEQIDYVSAHATSTPLGDITEVRSIRSVFGTRATTGALKVNAPKSMLGHTCWAAPVVESIAAILQMHAGTLHPSINIEQLDPEVDLDVCRGGMVAHPVHYAMKNAFGFGGINCVSILRNPAFGS